MGWVGPKAGAVPQVTGVSGTESLEQQVPVSQKAAGKVGLPQEERGWGVEKPSMGFGRWVLGGNPDPETARGRGLNQGKWPEPL